ncbi:MAG TPA: glutamine--fructose-6-phosphate transaminase (isomerizing) [Candidatus Magasanikbacteria bacterium]|nr:glutamine--fructose-6-phosphate transaminase (isomerizing) [Candidatus Magasanikbacteria bacterium]
MCGIVGHIGSRNSKQVVLGGLRRLEYRGYDSAGLSLVTNGILQTAKAVGKIDELEKATAELPEGNLCIGHTRWATHGGVTRENAHPHLSCDGKIAVVHNGIIENWRELRAELLGHKFVSETDTEVLAHLIEKNYTGDLRKAVAEALHRVRGTYGVAVVHADHPDELVTARLGSPIVIGVGQNEYFVASDATPILPYSNQVVFLNDGEMVLLKKTGMDMTTLDLNHLKVQTQNLDWSPEQAEKNGYEHFMKKEIFEEPESLLNAISGRIDLKNGTARLGGLNLSESEMRQIKRVIFIGCGTALYSAYVGKYAFERLAQMPAAVEIASEFRYMDPIIDEHTLVFAVSQSGETADTLAAMREAKRRGAVVRGIVNTIGSTIAREAGGGTYIHAGPELAVASTKAYINMSAVMTLYALMFGRNRSLSLATGERVVTALMELPEKIKKVLADADRIRIVAEKYAQSKNMYFLGRGVNCATALEASLKLKEVSYIHSEAYPGGEMKHGPIALLSPDFPVFAIATRNQLYDKMLSNIAEARARKAPIIALVSEGDEDFQSADDMIFVPRTMELFEPILNTVATQLFAYYVAVTLGRDVDRPRNLAKSVTVE